MKKELLKGLRYKGSNFIDRAVNNIENEFDEDILAAFSSEIDKELEKIK